MTTKEKILTLIRDINYAYNDCTMYETIKKLLEEMEEELRPTELATLKDAIKCGLPIPVIHCGQCRYWDELPSSTIAPEYHLCKRIAYHASTAEGFCDRAGRKEKPDDR